MSGHRTAGNQGVSKQKLLRKTPKSEPKQEASNPTITGLPPNRGMDTDLFGIIVSLVLAALVFILQANGVVAVTWVYSALAYAFLCVVTLWSCLKWRKAMVWRAGLRVLLCIGVLVVISGLGAWGTITEYQREHPVKYVKLP